MRPLSISELKELKKLYKDAVESGDELFIFRGRETYTSFAKYLIEFTELMFKTNQGDG